MADYCYVVFLISSGFLDAEGIFQETDVSSYGSEAGSASSPSCSYKHK